MDAEFEFVTTNQWHEINLSSSTWSIFLCKIGFYVLDLLKGMNKALQRFSAHVALCGLKGHALPSSFRMCAANEQHLQSWTEQAQTGAFALTLLAGESWNWDAEELSPFIAVCKLFIFSNAYFKSVFTVINIWIIWKFCYLFLMVPDVCSNVRLKEEFLEKHVFSDVIMSRGDQALRAENCATHVLHWTPRTHEQSVLY